MSRDHTNYRRHNSVKSEQHHNHHENKEASLNVAELIEKGLAGLEIHLDHAFNQLKLDIAKQISREINHKIDKHLHKFEKSLEKEDDGCIEQISNVSSVCNDVESALSSQLTTMESHMDGNFLQAGTGLSLISTNIAAFQSQFTTLQGKIDDLTSMVSELLA